MGLFDILSPVVSGVAGLASSAINYKSQVDTNRANSNINNRNNEFNAEQSELQRKWSAEEAEKARAFDTSEREAQQDWQEKVTNPSYQLGRWLDAGLSPAQFNADASPNGVPSGSSVGVPSGSAAQAANPIAMHSPNFDILSPSQSALNYAQAQAIKDENDRKNEMHSFEVQQAGFNLKLAEYDLNEMKPAVKAQLEKQTQELDAQIAEISSRIDLNATQEYFYSKQGELIQKNIDSFAQEFQKRLEEADSRISVNYASCRELAQRIAESVANVQNINADTKGKIIANGMAGLDFEVKKEGHTARLTYAWDNVANDALSLKYTSNILKKEARIASQYGEGLSATRAITEAIGGLLGGSSAVVRALK